MVRLPLTRAMPRWCGSTQRCRREQVRRDALRLWRLAAVAVVVLYRCVLVSQACWGRRSRMSGLLGYGARREGACRGGLGQKRP